jgi:hypothetical protein
MSTTSSVYYRSGLSRQADVSDLSRVILCLVVLRLEHSFLWVCVEQLHQSAISASSGVARGNPIGQLPNTLAVIAQQSF